jgi:hypothetical protein
MFQAAGISTCSPNEQISRYGEFRELDNLLRIDLATSRIDKARSALAAISGKAAHSRNRSCTASYFTLTLQAMEKMINIAGWWWAR